MTTDTMEKHEALLAVHSLDHFALSVPDLEVARFFYTEFGLDVREVGDTLELYTFGHPHRWGVIRKGERKVLDYISFGVYADDLPRFKAHFAANGIALIDAPEGVQSNGIWIRNLDGLPMELRVADKCSPDERTKVEMLSVGPGVSSAVSRRNAPRVYPRRLSHFLMFSTDVLRDLDFYARTLGLKLSDHSGPGVAFMHGAHGSDHHMLALAGSNARGMHHVSWDVRSVQEIGVGAAHMEDVGYAKGWGLGRHVLGGNYFHYVRDPWGSYAEYSCDIDYIPKGFEWPAADHPPEDAMYLWGPQVPADFIANLEAVES